MFNSSKVAATVCFKLLPLQFYESLVVRDPAMLKVLIYILHSKQSLISIGNTIKNGRFSSF